MTAEGDLLRAIMLALEPMQGVKVIRHNSGLVQKGARWIRLCEPGTPDLQVMIPGGQSVWIETKTNDKRSKVSDSQTQWHADAAKLGHAVYVVRSVEEAVRIVRQRRDAA